MTEPVGKGKRGKRRLPRRHLADERRGRRADEVRNERQGAYRANYDKVATRPGAALAGDPGVTGQVYNWPTSTYIAKPPFFDGFEMDAARRLPAAIQGARAMALFGDSITTDHISPAGAIKERRPPAVAEGARRHQGRLQLLRLAPRQPRGDDARHLRQRADQEPDDPARRRRLARGRRRDAVPADAGEKMFIYDAAMKYMAEGHADGRLRRRGVRHRIEPRLGGQGHAAARHQGGRSRAASSASTARTWSAWACCRCSSSRATRGNRSASRATRASTSRSAPTLRPQQDATLVIHASDGAARRIPLMLRIDTAIEVDYYRHGGILPFVLRQLLAA